MDEQEYMEGILSYLQNMREAKIKTAYNRSRDASTSSLNPGEVFNKIMITLDDLEKIEHHIARIIRRLREIPPED